MRFFVFGTMVIGLALFSRGASLISRGVLLVGDHVVTSREVLIGAVVERALSANPAGLNGIRNLEGASFRREASQMALEWMVFLEAQFFSVANVSQSQVDAGEIALSKYLSANGEASALWRALDPSKSEMTSTLQRKFRAKEFVQFKTKSSFVPVSDRDAQNYFNQNKAKFGGYSFEKFKESIKTVLGQNQADARMKEWFGILERKYSVRPLYVEKSE